MTQRERIRQLFLSRPGEWIPLPEILDMKIAQYGARCLELRREGMNIQNRWEMVNGQKHSWFRYLPQERQLEMAV